MQILTNPSATIIPKNATTTAVSTTHDQTLRLWDLSSARMIRALEGPSIRVVALLVWYLKQVLCLHIRVN